MTRTTPAAPRSRLAGPRVFAQNNVHPDGGVPPEEMRRLLAGPSPVWFDLDVADQAQAALLADVFQFHPRAIEAVMDEDTRVTFEDFETHLFVMVRAITFCETTPEDPYDLETANIALFLGKTFLVTAHVGPVTVITETARELQRDSQLLAQGPARLAHEIVESTVDEFFPLLDRIEEFLDGLEERVFAQFDNSVMHDIFQVKRLVLTLRRLLAPERDVVARLANRPTPYVSPDAQLYFRGTYDHVLRLNDSLETYRELLTSTLESFLTQVSNRLGTITKTLSIVATVTLPFLVVSGMWGMNFARIPLQSHLNGFWLLVLIQSALALVLFLVLRRRRVI